MRTQPLMIGGATFVLAGSLVFAQVGRGGSQWLTALGDAQRTSWVRIDDKISVPTMSNPGFELQWKVKLDNRPRGVHGLGQGVTASGVTLFVPMSLVTGSSNTVYGIDNDTGYIVWQRRFDVALPAPTANCPGGISAGATRIVRLDGTLTTFAGLGGGRGVVGYRSVLGEPGQGAPLEARGRSGGDPSPAGQAARGGGGGTPAPPAAAPPPARGAPPAERIPGAPRMEEGPGFRVLSRPSGVGYVISSDGMLHVLGLPSGKDMQRPARFVPANARWSSPIAVDTTLYASTSAGCGGAPHGVWAIDLDSEAKPVVSWKTNGGPVVGAVAFASDGRLFAAVGAGRTSGDGKANAIVALDPKTLQMKDWFTQPEAEFVTGPTILRYGDKDIVVAATKDGRVLLLDAKSVGGSDHATPLHASKTWLGAGAVVAADALATWQESSGISWILLPIAGRPASGVPAANGAIAAGGVIALKLIDGRGPLALEPGWVSDDLAAPATPMTVNGVVFTLATGVPATAAARGTPAVLNAYDGATGRRLWTSDKAMTTFASPGSFWTGLGQIYVGAQDGTLYAFGFNDERRPTTRN
jgi:PQQ-like domain